MFPQKKKKKVGGLTAVGKRPEKAGRGKKISPLLCPVKTSEMELREAQRWGRRAKGAVNKQTSSQEL